MNALKKMISNVVFLLFATIVITSSCHAQKNDFDKIQSRLKTKIMYLCNPKELSCLLKFAKNNKATFEKIKGLLNTTTIQTLTLGKATETTNNTSQKKQSIVENIFKLIPGEVLDLLFLGLASTFSPHDPWKGSSLTNNFINNVKQFMNNELNEQELINLLNFLQGEIGKKLIAHQKDFMAIILETLKPEVIEALKKTQSCR